MSSAIAVAQPSMFEEPQRPPDSARETGNEKGNGVFMFYVVPSYRTLSGEAFDGTRLAAWPSPEGVEVLLVPKLGGGIGFELGIGLQLIRSASPFGVWMNFAYARTPLNVRPFPIAGGGEQEAALIELALEMRFMYAVSKWLMPYVALSTHFGSLRVGGTHAVVRSNQVTFDRKTVNLDGSVFGAGIGLMVPVISGLTFDASAAYRGMTFSTIDGIETDEGWTAGGWVVRIGPTFVF
jgi:hypothetical protein